MQSSRRITRSRSVQQECDRGLRVLLEVELYVESITHEQGCMHLASPVSLKRQHFGLDWVGVLPRENHEGQREEAFCERRNTMVGHRVQASQGGSEDKKGDGQWENGAS